MFWNFKNIEILISKYDRVYDNLALKYDNLALEYDNLILSEPLVFIWKKSFKCFKVVIVIDLLINKEILQ